VKKYQYLDRYVDDSHWRESLNRLTQLNWGITVLHGGEADYVPFAMVYNNEVVANVCAGQFDLVINGEPISASMIQTVLTDESHRMRGLIRQLFDPVQSHIAQTTGRTFFTAHKDKVEFYRKFGYHSHSLVDHFSWPIQDARQAKQSLVKVDYQDDFQRRQFQSAANRRTPVSNQLGFVQRNWLLFWFCRYFLNNDIYYAEALDAYLVYRVKDDVLELVDIVAEKIPTWAELETYFDCQLLTSVKCFFTPDRLALLATEVMDDNFYFFTDGNLPLPALICLPETQRG